MIEDVLMPWQIKGMQQLSGTLRQPMVYGVADCSDTGVGKTYTALGVVNRLNLPTLVICPAIVIPHWERAIKELEGRGIYLSIRGVVSYEKLRLGKTSFGKWINSPVARRVLRCVLCGSETEDLGAGIPSCCAGRQHVWVGANLRRRPRFHFGSGIRLIIWDEAHRCMHRKTRNAAMLSAAVDQGIKNLLVSATLIEEPADCWAIGKALGLHAGGYSWWSWLRRQGYGPVPGQRYWDWLTPVSERRSIMDRITKTLTDAGRIYRQSWRDTPGFPGLTIDLAEVDLSPNRLRELTEAYKEIQEILEKLTIKQLEDPAMAMTRQLRCRQRIEAAKMPAMIDLAQKYLDGGCAVVLCFHFRDTLTAAQEILRTRDLDAPILDGQISPVERDKIVRAFQADELRFLLCNVGAIGLGIDLHDTVGRPRIGIISPGWDARQFVQVIGRFHRVGGRSPARCLVVFAHRSVESSIVKRVRQKLDNLAALTDENWLP